MLRVENLTKYYGQKCGLDAFSLTLNPQEIKGILGQNGSGKTTFFRVLMGLIPASSGVCVKREAAMQLGYMPEERCLLKDVRVVEHIELMARLKKVERQQYQRDIEQWLHFFGLDELRKARIEQLSKGNQQKIQFICAVIGRPQILVLDEPITGMDSLNATLLKQAIHQLVHEGASVLLSSHQYEQLEEFCQSIVILRKGKVILDQDLRWLKQHHELTYISVSYDEGANFRDAPGVVGYTQLGHLTRYRIKGKAARDQLMALMLAQRTYESITIEAVTIKDLVEMGDE